MNYHLDVKTTTFVNRHTQAFTTANDLLPADKQGISILQVGPGMAVKGVGRFNHLGKWQIIKRLETALRRLPLPISFYENFETREILDIFAKHSPQMTVGDISPKSLNSIKYNYGDEIANTIQLDLGQDLAPGGVSSIGQFDVVICLVTVNRVPRPLWEQARNNIGNFTRPGGILITDQNMTSQGFVTSVEHRHVRRKPAG